MLGLTLLGYPGLRRDGVPIALPIRKSMALLMLLARHDTPLPRARIAALLWPDLDEPTARRNLRRELARLRESGAGDAIDTAGDNVGLGAGVTVDAAAFDAAVTEGRADDALALWRGTPADGFALGDADAFDDWLARERQQLNERRRRALHVSAAAHEAGGDLDAALDRVDALLADDPLQEQHHRDAMRLLAANGRREAALARYERCRTLLRDELGLAPMAETDALAAQLRAPGSTASPAALVVSASPAAADALTRVRADVAPTRLPKKLPFIGRDREVAMLEAAWAGGQAIVIEGDGGVGKTRLANDFASAHGPYAMARCRAGDGDVPYAAFARALRALMGPTPALPEQPEWVVAEVARLVPELGSSAAPLGSDDERNRFFEACARAWQALSGDDFDAVVVDDWHLADSASRVLFAFVMRRRHEAGNGGAREIVVLRPELDGDAREALRAVVAATGATHVVLSALSGGDVLELVRRLSGAGEPTRFAGRLSRATGGNAFFLAETLRHLADTGLLTVDADGAWQTPFDASTEDYREIPVPASVHEAVLARARRLGASSQRVLEAAALAAEPFAPSLLAPACALSELETVIAIEAGVASGLLQEHASGGYAFPHDLIQQALAGDLSDARRRLVHRRLALGAEAAGAPRATIAAHHEASGDAQRAVAHRTAAGDEALALRALADAVAQWQKALADNPAPAVAIGLHQRISRAAFDRNDLRLAGEAADAVGWIVETATFDAGERLTAAVTHAEALGRAGRGADALAVLDTLPGEPAGQLRVAAVLARARAHDDLGRSDRALESVVAALAEHDAPDADRMSLLDFAFLCEFNAGRNEASLRYADAAMVLARRLGDSAGMARTHYRRGIALLTAHDVAGAQAAFIAAADAAERLGLVRLARIALYNLTCAYGSQSRHADALAAAHRGLRLQPPLEPSDFLIVYRLAIVDAQFGLGDIGAAWLEAEPAAREALAYLDLRLCIGAVGCLTELLGMIGQSALADSLIERVRREDEGAMKSASDEMWVVIAQHELRRGDVEAASGALGRLDATGGAVVERVKVRDAQTRAELALARGDATGALASLPDDDMLGMNEEMRVRGLALRIAAEARSGALLPATLAAAEAALAGEAPHAISQLEASHAFAATVSAPAVALDAHRALVERIASTLEGHPAERAAFAARWEVGSRSGP